MELIGKFNRHVDNIHPDEPLTQEIMEVLIPIMMGKDDPKFSEIVTSKHELLQQMPQAKAFMLRIENLTNLQLTVGAMLMIALHIESFGDSTMYAYYLHRKCDKDTIITIDYLSEKIFPWGMLSKDQRHKMWNTQKVSDDISREELGEPVHLGHDNLLDYAGVWKSVATDA